MAAVISSLSARQCKCVLFELLTTRTAHSWAEWLSWRRWLGWRRWLSGPPYLVYCVMQCLTYFCNRSIQHIPRVHSGRGEGSPMWLRSRTGTSTCTLGCWDPSDLISTILYLELRYNIWFPRLQFLFVSRYNVLFSLFLSPILIFPIQRLVVSVLGIFILLPKSVRLTFSFGDWRLRTLLLNFRFICLSFRLWALERHTLICISDIYICSAQVDPCFCIFVT